MGGTVLPSQGEARVDLGWYIYAGRQSRTSFSDLCSPQVQRLLLLAYCLPFACLFSDLLVHCHVCSHGAATINPMMQSSCNWCALCVLVWSALVSASALPARTSSRKGAVTLPFIRHSRKVTARDDGGVVVGGTVGLGDSQDL